MNNSQIKFKCKTYCFIALNTIILSLLKRNLFLSISLVYIFISCSKQPKAKLYSLDKDLKSKYNYKKGSYWIYRDSITGRLDSFYLLNVVSRYTGDPYPEGSPKYEFLEISIVQKNNNNLDIDSITWSFSLDAMYKQSPLLTARYQRVYSDITIYMLNFLSYKLLTTQSNLPNNWDSLAKGSIKMLPTYELYGNSFKNVAEIHYGTELAKTTQNEFYFNEDVGYIKMRITYDDGLKKINEVWELQRWQVAK